MDIETADPTEEQIEAMLCLHRWRAEAFGAELFGNPSWNLLLQLFAAKLRGQETRLAELTAVAPRSTLARWAAVLQERGLVSCRLGQVDSGDLWIEISSAGAAKMSGLFDRLRCLHPEASVQRWREFP